MTDFDNNGDQVDVNAKPGDGPDLLAPDYLLATLVELGNEAGLEIGIRLFVGGLVLSGTLVGGAKFFDNLSETLQEEAPVDDGPNALAGMFKTLANRYRSPSSDEYEGLTVEYIHLQDAWSHSPGQNPLIVGSWRGRLSKIDGWALGNYSQTS